MSSKPTAYSYIRFSSPAQAEGDSLRRQTAAAADWCQRNGINLDTSATLHDLGKSAYTGSHRTDPDRNALAGFLKMVETGRVPRGSYLVVENLDRLTREGSWPAVVLLGNLIGAGVRVVALKPTEVVYDESGGLMQLMMAAMEFSRGHGESAIKSERVGAAWGQRRKASREEGATLTQRLPAWIEDQAGERVLVEDRAATVRLIFRLAANGYGAAAIVKKLTGDGVPSFGASGHWSRSYVALILADRRAVGELQPKLRNGTADGPPLLNYFPPCVTESDWLAARAGASQRKQRPGRVSEHVNLFAGLLRDAVDGGTMYTATRTDGKRPGRNGQHTRVLVNTEAAEGRASMRSFPEGPFERAILSLLREVDPASILGTEGEPDEAATLAGELTGVESRIASLEAELAEGDVPSLARALRTLEGRRKELADQLAEARQRAAHPLSEAWGESRSLLDALDAATDKHDARLRLRSVLRRVIEEVWVLIVPRGRDRLAAVQVRFVGGQSRDYLILSRPPLANARSRTPGGWWARSLTGDDLPPLDLRDRSHAADLAEQLAALDLTTITG